MTMKIARFIGSNRFLSNFYSVAIEYEGASYPSVEHAFQAAKTLDHEARRPFWNGLLTAGGDAKRAGRRLALRPDWEDVKLSVMETILRCKFTQEPFRQLLLDTGDADLIEGNNWRDTYWGVDDHFGGENHLGRLLMAIREDLAYGRALVREQELL